VIPGEGFLTEVQTTLQLRHEVDRLQRENNELRGSLRRISDWLAAFGAGFDKLAEQEQATLKKHGTSLRLRGPFPTQAEPR
jgi:hypothetical protein